MFDKLRRRNQTPTPTPEELDYQDQIDALEKQKFDLHSEIQAYGDVNTKEKQALMSHRAEVVTEISHLRLLQDQKTDRESIPKINDLFHKTLKERGIKVTVNGHYTKIKKDLTLTLEFTPCKHKHTIHLKELLSHQRTIPNPQVNSYLLTKWQSLLSSNVALTAPFNCLTCRHTIDKKRIHSAKDIQGTCTVTLQVL